MDDNLLLQIHETVFSPVERGLVAIGVNAPWKTTLLFAGISAAAFFLIKPRTLFTSNGSPRPWNLLLKPDGTVSEEGTPVPWWLAASVTGYAAGLVI